MCAVHHPVFFDEFFDKGLPEEQSPFLTPNSRKWAKNLELKASIASCVLLLLAFGFHWVPTLLPISYLLLIGVYFLAGIPSLIDSIEDILRLEINIDVLMTLAAFCSVMIGSPMEGALLLVLFSISHAMEDAVTAKAKGAIQSLYKLSPATAWVVEENGHIVQRSTRDVDVGASILVKAGEIVPLDGVVIAGASSVNLVHLTGENLPVTKIIDDAVPSGGQNMEGSLTLRVTHTSGDSTISRIIGLVTQAQETKPRLQLWFESVSRRYALSVISLSAFFSLSLPIIFGTPFLGIEGSLYRSIAFLIAASPCALIIATPVAYLSAVSTCARQGILIKGGVTLDALASCSAIAFDKTGTLTTGELHLTSTDPIGDAPPFNPLTTAAALEKNAVHPIARAILKAVEKTKEPLPPITDVRVIPGYGVEGTVHNQKAYIGNPEYLETSDLFTHQVNNARSQGFLVAVLSVGEHLLLFKFEDTPRPLIKETIASLRQQKRWHLSMLTGDHLENAMKVSKELGIDTFYADLTPEDKLRHVENLTDQYGLAMVGDGINDAPALARATVGICMGKVGSATAAEAADVVLLHDDLQLLDWLMLKAVQTKQIVRQNLTLAGGVILLATTPALAGWIPLWLAVVLHEGGTVLVGLNALRLLSIKRS